MTPSRDPRPFLHVCGPQGSLSLKEPQPALARKSDPAESHEAAAKIAGQCQEAQEWLLEEIRELRVGSPLGPTDQFTDKNLCAWVQLAPSRPKGCGTDSGVRTRRKALADAGFLELVRDKDGKPVKRDGCRVWRLSK